MASKLPHSVFPVVQDLRIKDHSDPDDVGIRVVIRAKPRGFEICRPTKASFDTLVQADFPTEERAVAYCWQRYNADRRID